MSQLRNLLGNKVLRFRLGGGSALSYYRRERKSAPQKARRAAAEIEARLALRSQGGSKAPTQSKRPGLLRRFVATVRKAFGQ